MNKAMDIGAKVPSFKYDSMTGEQQAFSQHKGSHVVLYFYPRDLTPGCTKESEAFRDAVKKFEKLDTKIIGVSRDTLSKH